MIQLRRASERGHANHGWLDTYHTFSFADYHDPRFMGFRSLRVINDDTVLGGEGFDTHPHRDMEIVTLVLSGALRHRDTLGHEEVLRPGDVQQITAGTGIFHSEHNNSPVDPVHFLQIWLLPERKGLAPQYSQASFNDGDLSRLIVSRDGRDGSLRIHQDADLFLVRLEPGQEVEHRLRTGRHAWVHVAEGSAVLGAATRLATGDGASLSGEQEVKLVAEEPTRALIFDLA